MDSMPCPIWGDNVTVWATELSGAGVRRLESPRAGGKYEITVQAMTQLAGLCLTDAHRQLLTDWLNAQRAADPETVPLLEMPTIRQISG